jgi:dipeptidyl aminopeptidase/acylaminoacyl peptidase
MPEPKIAAYGSWKSPITPGSAASTTALSEAAVEKGIIYWRELHPEQKGRFAIVKRGVNGQTTELVPSRFNARTTVHEYGGGSYVVDEGVLYFSNFSDQRIYKLDGEGAPRPVTPKVNMRYADGVIDHHLGRMICIREDHSSSDQQAINTIVSLSLNGEDSGKVLVSGNHFYSSPRLNADGSRLAWITWNHPNMPWDGTELWVGQLKEDGSLRPVERIAGGLNESIVQPEWSPDGVLYFVSDRTGWWNLYRCRESKVEPLHEMDAEFARPHWVFGLHTYAFESKDRIVCTYTTRGNWHLAEIDTVSGKFNSINTPFTSIVHVRAEAGRVVFMGGSPTNPESIVELDLESRKLNVAYQSQTDVIDPAYVSLPEPIEYPTSNGLKAHAFYYPPRNPDFTSPQGEHPPLIVISHGGPTSATITTLRLATQFWTTRGFAVVDVNYGGSTGYGREYRQRLNGQWGVVDVDDCVNAAKYLVKSGLADGKRLAIRGGSAGGYTTLCALTFRDVFKAGASYYGISDLRVLDKETHKFESHYNVTLVGPYPERSDLYHDRSPINFVDRISCPMIIFQGLEDKIVTPNQAELMVEALRAKGLPYAYIAFEGEQHGFRRKENIARSLEAELYFYSKIFHFQLADKVEPVKIENLRV